IKREILTLAKISLIYAFWQIFAFIIGRLVSELKDWVSFIFCISIEFLFFSVNYVQTGWVLKEIVKKKDIKNNLLNQISESWEEKINLKTILSHKDGFEIFME